MQKLTLNRKYILLGILFFCSTKMISQIDEQTQSEFSNLIKDAIYFTDQYVTPATDAAVYQAASAWMVTPKKAELWDFVVGLHVNTFFVPKADRVFRISNDDLQFFDIVDGNDALTPTALGNRDYVTLSGMLGGSEILMKTPEGINRETVIYPYLQGALGLWKGTELIVKFAPEIKLKNVNYQVYGAGVKHNISQYFPKLNESKIHIATLLAYSKEDLTVNFLDIETKYGNFGFTRLNSQIDTYQFQINASKEFNKLEIAGGLILNSSNFEYFVAGKRGEIEEVIPLRSILNEQLQTISKTKFNCIGEISARYQISKFFIQPTIAFGKFVNSNIAVQYSI